MFGNIRGRADNIEETLIDAAASIKRLVAVAVTAVLIAILSLAVSLAH